MHRRALFLVLALVLGVVSACGGGDPAEPALDTSSPDTTADAPPVPLDTVFADTAPDAAPDAAPDLATDLLGDALIPPCDPGEGCFGDPCGEGKDCLSGWCVDHLGDGVCTQTCEEECPAGWTCQQVAGTAPDLIFVCVSDFANLCKPCEKGADCVDSAGTQDVCVDYGVEGNFCGGACGDEKPCPAGYVCEDVETVDGVPTTQCVLEGGGVCACSDKAIDLAMWTPCEETNVHGTCVGIRACVEGGLSDCDAQIPAAESCNGEDDDCDGVVDEEICDDDNPCTDDQCIPGVGCEHLALDGIPCAGEDPCAGEWICDDGACVGEAKDCDDGKACTVDSCDPVDGHCDHAAVDGNCPASNNPCVGQVFCDPFAGPEADPDQDGCVVVMKAPGTGCDDGDLCTTGDNCQEQLGSLYCTGAPVDFDDSNPCTTDSCDPDLGPKHEWIPGCEVPCTPGETTSADCGLCGTHSKTCPESGKWSDAAWGDCLGEGICTPNVNETEACGNCGTQTRTCTGLCQWGAWGECQAEGTCTPGELKYEACEGLCTAKAATCGDDCQWGVWGACEDQGDCTPGDADSQACGQCGTQSRSCTELCTWGDWGICNGEGACAPGALDDQACGDCGSQSRTCTDQCQWGAWGACEDEGACTVAALDSQACGACGTQTRQCNALCEWGAWGVCGGEGACAVGESDTQACGQCGSQSRSCTDQCQWGAWGACGGEGACSPGAFDEQSCGDCGTQTRTCTDQCQWSAWGACGGQGACSVGATDSMACGDCGTQTRTCTAQCQWGGWSGCGGEGVCSTGQTQNQACGDCGSQSRSCTAQCQWGSWGSCTGQGPCSPFENQSQSCGDCGTQNRQCTGQCQWGSWSGCFGEGVCGAGELEFQSCGNCGSRARSCTGSCTWGSWGACEDPCACECSGGTCCSDGCNYDNYGSSCSSCKSCNSSGSCSVNKSNGTSCSGGVCYNGSCKDCIPGEVEYCDPNCGAFNGSNDGYRECSGSGYWGTCKPVVCEPNGTTYYQAVPDDYSWHCKDSSVFPGELSLCLKTYTFWICGVPVIEFHLKKIGSITEFDNDLKVTLRNVDKGKTKTYSFVDCAGQEECYFTEGVAQIISDLNLSGTDSFEADIVSPNVGGIYGGTTGKAELVKCY